MPHSMWVQIIHYFQTQTPKHVLSPCYINTFWCLVHHIIRIVKVPLNMYNMYTMCSKHTFLWTEQQYQILNSNWEKSRYAHLCQIKLAHYLKIKCVFLKYVQFQTFWSRIGWYKGMLSKGTFQHLLPTFLYFNVLGFDYQAI